MKVTRFVQTTFYLLLQISQLLAVDNSNCTPLYIPEYFEMTRRIDLKEQKLLEEQINSLPTFATKFLEGVQTGDFGLIFQTENYPIQSLLALKQGKISREDFATIMLIHSSQDGNKECVRLFTEKGEMNQEAKQLIEQTLKTDKGAFLSKEQLYEFFGLMNKQSPLQQQFFLEMAKTDLKSSFRSLIKEKYAGFNPFGTCQKKNKDQCMIPSAGMMQSLLDVKYKENAIRMNFVLGLSSVEDIEEDGYNNIRDVAVRFPGVFLPSEADNAKAPGTDFSYHDFFHSIIVSSASPDIRRRFIRMATIIRNLDLENCNSTYDFSNFDIFSLEKEAAKKIHASLSPEKQNEIYQNEKTRLYHACVDMELFWYYMYSISDIKLSDYNLFFIQLHYLFNMIASSNLSKELIFKTITLISNEILTNDLKEIEKSKVFFEKTIDFLNKTTKTKKTIIQNLQCKIKNNEENQDLRNSLITLEAEVQDLQRQKLLSNSRIEVSKLILQILQAKTSSKVMIRSK